MFIDGECENLIVVNDGGELPRNIKQKKKSEFYSSRRCPLSNRYCRRELSSPIAMWNIVNQLRKHDFSCVSVVIT